MNSARLPFLPGPRNAKNYDGFGRGTKETVSRTTIVAFSGGEFHQPVKARWYRSRSAYSTRIYCSIWVHGPLGECSGTGWTDGGGYHMDSAALSSALESAGITLETEIAGIGAAAMIDALKSIALAALKPLALSTGFSGFHHAVVG